MKNICFILLLILFASCSNKAERNITEEINSSYSNALQEQISLSNKIQQSISKGDFASFKADVDSCIVSVNNEISTIEKLNVQPSDENFRKATLEALTSFKKIAEVGQKFNQLNVNSTEEEYNTLISLFNELVNNEIPEKINVVSKSKESLPKNE